VQDLSIGKSPGLDGLPSEFFFIFLFFITVLQIGKDYYKVISFSIQAVFLPIVAEEQFFLRYQKR